MTEHERLERIEQKLDKMSDAIVSLARMEERMISLFKRMDAYDEKQSQLENRVLIVESNQATQKGSNSWTDKVVWLIIAAALSAALFVGK